VSEEEVKAILSIPIPVFQRSDVLVWHYSVNGIFSVKTGYHVAFQEHRSQQVIKPSSSILSNPCEPLSGKERVSKVEMLAHPAYAESQPSLRLTARKWKISK
jgi:hypothetical protein